MKTIACFHRAKPFLRRAALRPILVLATLFMSMEALRAADFSEGNYRIPYADGSTVQVLFDHLTHVPPDRIDLFGGTNGNQIVAAADGVVRFIVDTNTISCTTNGCANFNNYVWIEHPNGEWTKYSQLSPGSATGAGISVGMNVTAGTLIGLEGDIGFSPGTNLHFEVGVPDNPADPISIPGGFIKGVNRIPIICGIPDNIFLQGTRYFTRVCDAPPITRGIYRVPYTNDTQVFVSRDHNTHSPVPVRYDLRGTGGTGPYKIVAAAAGTVMAVVDTNTITCTTNGCANFNNYVWIAHPNGEWTKYTHFQTGTVRAAPPNGAGLFIGMAVSAGTYLGDEDDVGSAGGIHLHFEAAVPTNSTTPFDHPGGFINGYNLIPVMCGVPGSILNDDATVTANPCGSDRCPLNVTFFSGIEWGERVTRAEGEIEAQKFTVDTYASVAFRADRKITLKPGFRALRESYFHALIRDCN
jgi:murein DD-endopeptidase MepM/ murein hydrolase activator NlpD